MSRVNKFQEGHGPLRESYSVPAIKRRNRKRGFRMPMEMKKEKRGFASMSLAKRREIASKGGRAAHQKGTAHEWTPEEALIAGKKGGLASRGGRGKES